MKSLQIFVMMGFGLLLGAPAWAGSYTVPTQNPQLMPYAQFEIPDLQIVRENGSLRVSYTLPVELTGNEVTIVLSSKDFERGSADLRGEFGKATCFGSSCEVDYKHLPIDREVVKARLWEISATQEEFDARLQVAMEFEGNPIGIVNLDAPLFSPGARDRKSEH